MSKKQRTPQQQIKRGKAAMTLIAVMLIVYLASLCVNRPKPETADVVENIMNEKLDSLFTTHGYKNAEITNSKAYRLINVKKSIPEEDTLFLLKMSLEIKSFSTDETTEMNERIAKLQDKVEKHKNSKDNTSTYYNRRIYFKTKDKKEYTCIQTLDTLLKNSELKHITKYENIEMPEIN